MPAPPGRGVDIVIGRQLGTRLPERAVQIGASVLFFVFAAVLMYEALS